MTDIHITDTSTAPAPLSLEAKVDRVYVVALDNQALMKKLETKSETSTALLADIKANTATMASFFTQLETMTRIAAGKDQISSELVTNFLKMAMRFVTVVVVAFALYAITNNIKDSNVDVRIPWLGLEVLHPVGGKPVTEANVDK